MSISEDWRLVQYMIVLTDTQFGLCLSRAKTTVARLVEYDGQGQRRKGRVRSDEGFAGYLSITPLEPEDLER